VQSKRSPHATAVSACFVRFAMILPLVIALVLALACPSPVAAQTAASKPADKKPPEVAVQTPAAAVDAPTEDAIKQRAQELDAARTLQKNAEELQQKLKADAAAIGQDRSKLNQQLIDIAARCAASNPDRRHRGATAPARCPRAAHPRFAGFAACRDRRSAGGLATRRTARPAGAAGETGRRAAIAAHRHAARAVVPEMRSRAEDLVNDLGELVALRKSIADERDRLATDRDKLTTDRTQLAALVDERQKQQSALEKDMEAERSRAATLSKQVETLQDLIAKMERDLKTAAKAAAAASLQGPRQP